MRHLYEEAMKYELPLEVGERGSCRIVRKTVTEEEASLGRMRAAFHPGGRYTPAGTYWGLLINGNLVMSDTPDERHDHLESVYRAKGHCLVNGLGLGMVAGIMLENPRVELVTVVEINENVIDLVEPHYSAKYGSHVEIVHCDALTYQPPKGIRYGAVWHDIWGDICPDNLPQMHTLHRRYGRRSDWQGSWCRALCERYR